MPFCLVLLESLLLKLSHHALREPKLTQAERGYGQDVLTKSQRHPLRHASEDTLRLL